MSNTNQEPYGAPRISSPLATGGRGTFYEQHVNAFWLCHLLVKARPPIITECFVEEVHFQTERLGHCTDDFLVVGKTTEGTSRKLLGQAKTKFSLCESDPKCTQAISDFWEDFNNESKFSQQQDCLVLVIQNGNQRLVGNLVSLTDCARNSLSAEDFSNRLSTPGYLNKVAVTYCELLCRMIEAFEGRALSPIDIWPFLKALHLLHLDLFSATRLHEAHAKNLLSIAQNYGCDPHATWNELLSIASYAMPGSRTFTMANLPSRLRASHSTINECVVYASSNWKHIPLNNRDFDAIYANTPAGRAKGLIRQVLPPDQTLDFLLNYDFRSGRIPLSEWDRFDELWKFLTRIQDAKKVPVDHPCRGEADDFLFEWPQWDEAMPFLGRFMAPLGSFVHSVSQVTSTELPSLDEDSYLIQAPARYISLWRTPDEANFTPCVMNIVNDWERKARELAVSYYEYFYIGERDFASLLVPRW